MPTAIKTVELDRLLSVTDSRIIAAAWIDAHHGSAAWCETGSVYGRPHPDRGAALDCPDRAGAVWPAYVVVQRSPLSLYSELPASAELTLSSLYVVVQSFRTGAGTLGEDDYDPADAFFVPLH